MALTASYVKQTIADLLQNKIDMSQLVITKALAKAGQLARHVLHESSS
jgi:DNA polymerase delta subunit 1